MDTFSNTFLPDGYRGASQILRAVERLPSVQSDHSRPSSQDHVPTREITIVHKLSQAEQELEKLTAENEQLRAENQFLTDKVKTIDKLEERLRVLQDKLKQCEKTGTNENVANQHEPVTLSQQPLVGGSDGQSQPQSYEGTSQRQTLSPSDQDFNSLPKSLRTFYNQMCHGDDKLPPFAECGSFRAKPSTKSAYCKRKRIFDFIESYDDGSEKCLDTYKAVTTSKLYDTYVKKPRK